MYTTIKQLQVVYRYIKCVVRRKLNSALLNQTQVGWLHRNNRGFYISMDGVNGVRGMLKFLCCSSCSTYIRFVGSNLLETKGLVVCVWLYGYIKAVA